MLVHFEDTEYDFDIEGMDLSEARYIFKQTGLTIRGLLEGLEDFNPEALVALYWLMLKQSGKVRDIGKLNFKVVAFAEALAKAVEAEEPDGEEDPTNAATAAQKT